MAITSDEVNYLVYRYLQESGFMHSAFTFAYESQLAKTNVISTELPPGALVSFIQKGLQYVGIEAHINEDGTERECEGEITLLSPHICRVAQSATSSARSLLPSSSKVSNKRKRKAIDGIHSFPDDKDDSKEVSNGTTTSIDSEDMVLLSGHVKEVYGCIWNPCYNLLVSGSSDSTARVWKIDTNEFVSKKAVSQPPIVLDHGTGSHKDVTTMEWNHDGMLLATGTYNGKTRIWSSDGTMKHSFQHHSGPVFAARWSESSCFLLSASFDKSVSIWDVKNESKQQIKLHEEPILDASWKDDETFATCSADRRICITKVGATQSEIVLQGHREAINSVKWDPSGRLLASCSDDYTVNLWDPSKVMTESDRNNGSTDHESTVDGGVDKKPMYLHSFQEHKKEVYTFRWSPGSNLPNGPSLTLASASFDTTVKLWDVESLTCLQTFEHSHPVYGVSYSPNGEYLASGTIGGVINVWSLKSGSLLKSYQANGDIYEVNWNKDGDLISACASSGDVAIIHFRL